MTQIAKKLRRTITRLRSLFLGVALVLAGGLLVSYYAGRSSLVAAEEVVRRDAVIERLQSILLTLQDMETGQRGYLLTGKSMYLDPFKQGQRDLPVRLDDLKNLASTDTKAGATIADLETLVRKKADELEKTIELYQSGDKKGAMAIVSDDSGWDAMEDIRSRAAEMRSYELILRRQAEDKLGDSVRDRGLAFLAAAGVNLAFLVWVYRRIRREMSMQYVANLETQRQREILSVTLSSIGDAVIVTDMGGNITFMNPVAETLTGWPASEAEETPCSKVFRLITEKDRKPIPNPVEKILTTGRIAGAGSHTLLIRRDGSEIPIDDSGAPIRQSDGSLRGVVLTFRDFTAHKAAESMLIEAKEKTEEAARAKDRFIATLSHELLTPLTPVLATVSEWRAGREFPDELREGLELIRRNVDLEARLIDDLLDLTRIQSGKLKVRPEPVDAHEVIRAVLLLSETERSKRGIQISVSDNAEKALVNADPARFQQVLWNILGNAVKFTPDNGRIEIRTSNPVPGTWEAAISDSGIGMSENTLARIFRPFEQADEGGTPGVRGLGLGLSIVKALVEAHGGSLEARSDGLDKGSTLVLRLPLVPEGVVTAPKPVLTEPKSLRIFLLEDHEDSAQALASVLRGLGHTVKITRTVAQASAEICKGEYDLILSDIGLPDGTGIDFLGVARQFTKAPAVALTGYGMDEDIENCRKAGFEGHIIKPVEFEDLEKAVERWSRV
jgi:PAS domain S-box-containing protein